MTFLPKIVQSMKRIKSSVYLYDNSKFLQQCLCKLFVFKETVLYHCLVPKSCTTVLYQSLVPQSCTKVLYHCLVPKSCTTVLYQSLVPKSRTTVLYQSLVPQSCTTVLYQSLVPQSCTTVLYHSLVPKSRTTVLYHSLVPVFKPVLFQSNWPVCSFLLEYKVINVCVQVNADGWLVYVKVVNIKLTFNCHVRDKNIFGHKKIEFCSKNLF